MSIPTRATLTTDQRRNAIFSAVSSESGETPHAAAAVAYVMYMHPAGGPFFQAHLLLLDHAAMQRAVSR